MTVASIFKKSSLQPSSAGIDCRIGAEFIGRMDLKIPRCVWVPKTDAFRPGKIVTGLDGSVLSDPSLRAFLTRTAMVDIHLWSKANKAPPEPVDEIEAMEELVRRVLVSIRRTNPGNFAAESLTWDGGDGREEAEYGRKAVLLVGFEVPIYETNLDHEWTVTEATTESQTGTLTEADGTGGDTGSPAP